MDNPKCWNPEKDNPYPLCIGETIDNEVKDKCKECCLYTEYEVYNPPYKDD